MERSVLMHSTANNKLLSMTRILKENNLRSTNQHSKLQWKLKIKDLFIICWPTCEYTPCRMMQSLKMIMMNSDLWTWL